MSTVTLSQPHCAMTSAENPEGMASHPLTAALPALHRSFSLFSVEHGVAPPDSRFPSRADGTLVTLAESRATLLKRHVQRSMIA
jgi:hypothetical protein